MSSQSDQAIHCGSLPHTDPHVSTEVSIRGHPHGFSTSFYTSGCNGSSDRQKEFVSQYEILHLILRLVGMVFACCQAVLQVCACFVTVTASLIRNRSGFASPELDLAYLCSSSEHEETSCFRNVLLSVHDHEQCPTAGPPQGYPPTSEPPRVHECHTTRFLA
jgi:hypothetical protein